MGILFYLQNPFSIGFSCSVNIMWIDESDVILQIRNVDEETDSNNPGFPL